VRLEQANKAQAKAQAQACELRKKDALTYDDKWFVLENR
jgi:hypothetical protein